MEEENERYELVGTEQTAYFDAEDIERMALDGLVVVSRAWAQEVYRVVPMTQQEVQP